MNSLTPFRLLITADAIGGVWTYALDLAAALRPYEIEIGLATMGSPLSKEQKRAAEALPHVTLFKSGYRLEWMDDPWNDVNAAGGWLLEVAEEFSPDVVHLNGYAHASLPWNVPVLVAAHSCVLSWWQAVKGENAPVRYAKYASAVVNGLRAADLVVAPSQAMLDCIETHYGLLPRTRVIPNGRDAKGFLAGLKRPFVVSAGRLWDEAKNIGTLDAIAHHLPWRVYVAGAAGGPDGMDRQFEHLQLLGQLSQRELARQLSQASIFALPARYEPFGLAVLEAAHSGCALVLGDIPSLREIWGDAAVFVAPNDHHALRSALLDLIAEDARREELAAAARKRAAEYSTTAMGRRYLAAYRELRAASKCLGPNATAQSMVLEEGAIA